MKTSGTLLDIFHNPQRGLAWKWPHYFDIYEEHFNRFRGKAPTVLEIGVCHGGSLWMWKNYLAAAQVIGIDYKANARQYEGEGVAVCIGRQEDDGFLTNVADTHGPFDIIIDDGSHNSEHQASSCRALFPHLAAGGVYMIEDLICGAGDVVTDFLATLLHAPNWRRSQHAQESGFVKELKSIHVYEMVAVLVKGDTSRTESAIKSEHPRT
jgi:cephalosporin hydroxylase